MNDIQNILDSTFPFVESLLKEYGEFYPLASAINSDGKVEQILLEEDEEIDFPESVSVLGELKKELRWRKNDFKAVAIFYDVNLKENNTSAIAVSVEHEREKEAFIFYYPYQLIDGNLVYGESWKVVAEMQIFW
ncbi:hypothetical protein [Flavobacterium panacagri]|uniref:hypothetical protein n=1 Tax=Flavobacterium panacagri TaxID=3034146 RepID=UPI0025A63584|nr:hypothetical protein [Flavobacterium panacagri]